MKGCDDGEITLSAEAFAREIPYIFPYGMNRVRIRKADRHHDDQILQSLTGLLLVLLAQTLRIEGVVVRHRWKQDVPAIAGRFPRRGGIGFTSRRKAPQH